MRSWRDDPRESERIKRVAAVLVPQIDAHLSIWNQILNDIWLADRLT